MTNPIADFWFLFQARAAELAATASADTAVYDALLRRLQDVNAGLYFEFSANSDKCELVLTADGKVELFDLVREVVAAAPPIQGWLVRALKPRLGFPKEVRWEGVVLDLATVTFDPLERAGSPDLGLRILIPGLGESQIDDAHNAILRAIDHGLGEERHAVCIRHTELLALRKALTPRNLFRSPNWKRLWNGETAGEALANKALQQTGLSVATLPPAPAAERRYVGRARGPDACANW